MKKKQMLIVSIVLVLMMAIAGCGGASESADASASESANPAGTSESGDAQVYDGPTGLPEDGVVITINTEGMGQITSAEEGNPLGFSDEYPIQSSQVTMVPSSKLVIAAKADDGWKFVKWTMNGEDYATDEQITITVTDSAEFVAYFEPEE